MGKSKWITVQMFLSSGQEPAVYEVEFHTVDSALRCSCPGFGVRKTCKHVRDVQAVMDANGGDLPLRMFRQVSREQARELAQDPSRMREIAVRHGEIKVV